MYLKSHIKPLPFLMMIPLPLPAKRAELGCIGCQPDTRNQLPTTGAGSQQLPQHLGNWFISSTIPHTQQTDGITATLLRGIEKHCKTPQEKRSKTAPSKELSESQPGWDRKQVGW